MKFVKLIGIVSMIAFGAFATVAPFLMFEMIEPDFAIGLVMGAMLGASIAEALNI